MKRYFLRVVRYTIYIISLFIIIFTIMHLTNYAKITPEMFGAFFASPKSMVLWLIMLVLILLHPLISYVKRPLGMDINSSRDYIIGIFNSYDYIIEKENEEEIIFRKKSTLLRIISPNDDTIIIYKGTFPTIIEGNRKALVRIILRLKP